MKVTAYLTQCCNKIKSSDEIHGIETSNDLFSNDYSFKTILNPEKSDVHYCTECYMEKVTKAADKLVYRKGNEEKYQEKLKELAFLFKKSLFSKK